MDMPLHVVAERVDILVVCTGKMRCQVMTDHRGDRFAAAPAGIRVAGSVCTVIHPDGRRDQFEMGMVAVFGVRENFLERNLEMSGVDTFDTWHWRAAFGLIEGQRVPYALTVSSRKAGAGWFTRLATMRS